MWYHSVSHQGRTSFANHSPLLFSRIPKTAHSVQENHPLSSIPSKIPRRTHPSKLREINRRSRRRDLDDSGPVQDHGIRDGGVGRGLGEEDVRLAHRRGGNHRGNHAACHSRHDGRGAETAHEDDIKGGWERSLDAKRKRNALRSRDALGRRQGGERHDGERYVCAGAGFDKGGGEGVDGVEAEGGAVGVRGGDLAEVEALDRGVEGLGDEDGARDAEVGFAGDEARAAEVGGCADAFEDRGEADEGFGVRVREIVGACCDGLGARGREGGGEEFDVLFFVVGDVFEVVVVGRAEAGF